MASPPICAAMAYQCRRDSGSPTTHAATSAVIASETAVPTWATYSGVRAIATTWSSQPTR